MLLAETFPSYAVSAIGPRPQAQSCVACPAPKSQPPNALARRVPPGFEGSGVYAERGPWSLLGLVAAST